MTTRLAGLALTMALLVTAPAAQTNEARVLLEAARRIETVDGNLPAAIAKYQEIVDRYEKTDRAAAAQALVRIGECARLAANDGRARAAFERIIREFSDQEEAATLARVRLANGQASPKGIADAAADLRRLRPAVLVDQQ